MTKVTITGTGMPPIEPWRAGPGVLVQDGDIALQFDVGRATSLRIAEAGAHPADLNAVFITHHHSDHVSGAPDLVFGAWVKRPNSTLLTFVAPEGPSTRFLARMLDAYDEDIAIRVEHTNRAHPAPTIIPFEASPTPTVVWSSSDDQVRVTAVKVHHLPVDPAVAYRVDTPSGSVVISGDTKVCDEIEALATGCNVLVHEAFRVDEFVRRTNDPSATVLGDYHSDTVTLGEMAERIKPDLLMLTHLAPAPRNEADKQAFIDDVRRGGYTGEVMVCDDLDSTQFGAR